MSTSVSSGPSREPSPRVYRWIRDNREVCFLVLRSSKELWDTPREQRQLFAKVGTLCPSRVVFFEKAGEGYLARFSNKDGGAGFLDITERGLEGAPSEVEACGIEDITQRQIRRTSYFGLSLFGPSSASRKLVDSLVSGKVDHRSIALLRPGAILSQLQFVAKALASLDAGYYEHDARSGAQLVSEVLEEASQIGANWEEAKVGSPRQQQLVLASTLKAIKTNRRPVVVPVGRGENENFVQHFVIFSRKNGSFEVKTVCLRSPKSDAERFYSTMAFTVEGQQIDPLVRALFHLDAVQPEERGVGNKSGPKKSDRQLERVLNELRDLRDDRVSVHGKVVASRNPVRLLYELVCQLQIQEGPIADHDPQIFDHIKKSKRAFYSFYVDALTDFYEKEVSSLGTEEKKRVLDSIQFWSERIEEEVRFESGSASVGQEVVAQIKEQVRRGLEKLEEADGEAKRIARNLSKPAKLFKTLLQSGLADGSAQAVQEELKLVESKRGVRVTGDQFDEITQFAAQFALNNQEVQLESLRTFLGWTNTFLEKGDADSAYSIAFAVLQSLPTPSKVMEQAAGRFVKEPSFWTCFTEEQLFEWLKALDELSSRCLEAALKSSDAGDNFPLSPKDCTHFYLKLPLLMRELYEERLKKLPLQQGYVDHVDRITGEEFRAAAVQERANRHRTKQRELVTKQVKDRFGAIKGAIQSDLRRANRDKSNEESTVFVPPRERFHEAPQEYRERCQRLRTAFDVYKQRRIAELVVRIRNLEEMLTRHDSRYKRALALSLGDPVPHDADQEHLPAGYYLGDPQKDAFLQWLEERIYNQPEDAVKGYLKGVFTRLPSYVLGEADLEIVTPEEIDKVVGSFGAYASDIGFKKEFLTNMLAHKQGIRAVCDEMSDERYLRLTDYSQTTGEDSQWEKTITDSIPYLRYLQAQSRQGGGPDQGFGQVDVGRFMQMIHEANGGSWKVSVKMDRLASFECGLRVADGLGWSIAHSKNVPFFGEFLGGLEAFGRYAAILPDYFLAHQGVHIGTGEQYVRPETALIRKQEVAANLLARPGFIAQAGRQDKSVRKALSRLARIQLEFVASGSGASSLNVKNALQNGSNYYTLVIKNPPEIDWTELNARFLATSSERARHKIGRRDQQTGQIDLDDERKVMKDPWGYPEMSSRGDRFIMQSTAVHKRHLEQGEHELSSLSLRQSLNYFYREPTRVTESPELAYILYNRIFQHGLIRDALLKDPDSLSYFTQFGRELESEFSFERILDSELEEPGQLMYLFMRLISMKIKRQANKILKELQDMRGQPWVLAQRRQEIDNQIARIRQIEHALPSLQEGMVKAVFNNQDIPRNEAAFYLLAYYCEVFINEAGMLRSSTEDSIGRWKNIFESAFYLRKCAEPGGHAGLQMQYLRFYSEELLPFLEREYKEDGEFIQIILQAIVASNEVTFEESKPYVFKGGDFEIDLQTCEGMPFQVPQSQHMLFTQELKDKLNELGCRLYESPEYVEFLEPPANKRNKDSEGKKYELYQWHSEHAENTHFQIGVWRIGKKIDGLPEVYQKVGDKRFLFVPLKTDSSKFREMMRSSKSCNRELEDKIDKKGVWVEVDQRGRANYNKVMLAQVRQDLNPVKEPLQLMIADKQVIRASVGSENNKRIVCSGLDDANSEFLPFCPSAGLLYFSRDGSRITEVQFPSKEDEDPFVLVNRGDNEWVVKGGEGWKWDQKGSGDLERLFGKNHRSYVLPLVCGNEKRYIVFPYLMGKTGKRGEEPSLLRTPKELLGENGLLDLHSLIDMVMRSVPALAEAEENAELLADGLQLVLATENIDFLYELANKNLGEAGGGAFGKILKSYMSLFHVPTPFEIHENTSGQTSSHAGFFYMAMRAASVKNYTEASYYLSKMCSLSAHTDGDSEFEQLQQMVMRFVGMAMINGSMPKSAREKAFMLRSFASLFRISKEISAKCQKNLLSIALGEVMPLDHIPQAASIDLVMKIVAQGLYAGYQQSLQDPKARKKLEASHLILSAREERILDPHPLIGQFAYSQDLVQLLVQGVGQQQHLNAGLDFLTKFFVKEPTSIALPQLDIMPSEAEVERFLNLLLRMKTARTFSSVEALHKACGKEPKWETVVSNFWLYYEWIFKEDVKREDLSFLFHHVDDKRLHFEEVNIARRLLLTLYLHRDLLNEDILEIAKRDWANLPQHGEHSRIVEHFKREFEKDPSMGSFAMRLIYQFALPPYMDRLALFERIDGEVLFNALPALQRGEELPEDLIPENEMRGGVVVPRQMENERMKTAFDLAVKRPLAFLWQRDVPRQLFLGPAAESAGTADEKPEEYIGPTIVEAPDRMAAYTRKRQQCASAAYELFESNLQGILERFKSLVGEQNDGVFDDAINILERSRASFTLFAQIYLDSQDSEHTEAKIDEIIELVVRQPQMAATLSEWKALLDFYVNPTDVAHLPDDLQQLGQMIVRARQFARMGLPIEAMGPYVALLVNPDLNALITHLFPEQWQPFVREFVAAIRSGNPRDLAHVFTEIITKPMRELRESEYKPALVDRSSAKGGNFACNPVVATEETPAAFDMDEFFAVRTHIEENLDRKIDKAKTYIQKKSVDDHGANSSEEYYLKSVEKGLEEAKGELLQRTAYTLKKSELNNLADKIQKRYQLADAEERQLRVKLVKFASVYQEQLGLTYLFAGKTSIASEPVIKALLNLYDEGTLDQLRSQPREDEITNQLTRFLYAATEMAQLKRAIESMKRMYQLSLKFKGDVEQTSIEWQALSQQVKESLEGGTDRRRYLDTDGRFLDSALGRSYLLFDYRTGFVTRKLARELVEKIIAKLEIEAIIEPKEGETDEAYRERILLDAWTTNSTNVWQAIGEIAHAEHPTEKAQHYLADTKRELHILRMGLGKTTFISPLVACELAQRGKRPVCMTTNLLVDQLRSNLGPRAFFFEFDLDYGLKSNASFERRRQFHERSCGLSKSATKEEVDEHLHACAKDADLDNSDQMREKHLDLLYDTLMSLEEQGRYVVTTPEQMAMLNNKRVMLQNEIAFLPDGEQRTQAFCFLQKVKKIESYFYNKKTVFIPDEDVNLAINFDYNVAQGSQDMLNSIRFDVAEKMFMTILNAHTDDGRVVEKRGLVRDLANAVIGHDRNVINGLMEKLEPKIQSDEMFLEESESEEALAEQLYESVKERNDEAQEIAYAVLRNDDAREKLLPLRNKIIADGGDLRAMADFKKELRPLAQALVRDEYYWKESWGFGSWVKSQNEEDALVNYLLGISKEAPACVGRWDKDKTADKQEHLCALAALRTFLSTTFETVASVNPYLQRGIRQEDGVTPVPYEDGLERKNILYATETEYILHAMLLYIRGRLPVRESVFEERFNAMKRDDERVSRNSAFLWKQYRQLVCAKQGSRVADLSFDRPYPILMGLGTPAQQERLDQDPLLRDRLRVACMQERLFLLRAMLPIIPIFSTQVSFNANKIPGRQKVELLSGTGDDYALGMKNPEGFDPQTAKGDHIAGETILSFKDLDERVTVFESGGATFSFIKEQLKDPNCKAILNQDYPTDPARAKELVSLLRKSKEGQKRQFIYRDSKTREKMMWNPGEMKPVPYKKEMVKREESFFLYLPPDRRGVDFAVPQGEDFYAVAMVGVGIDADTHDQLVWRMRQFGTGQQVRFAIDHKTESQVKVFCEEGEEIKAGHILRYVQRCTVKGRELDRIKQACADVARPLDQLIHDVLSSPYDLMEKQSDTVTLLSIVRDQLPEEWRLAPENKQFKLLEEFESQVLFMPHKDMLIQQAFNDWESEFGQKGHVGCMQFLENMVTKAIEHVNAKEALFLDGRAGDEHNEPVVGLRNYIQACPDIADRDRHRLEGAIIAQEEPQVWQARLPIGEHHGENYAQEYQKAVVYAISMNEMVRKGRQLMQGYRDVKEALGKKLDELHRHEAFFKAYLPREIASTGSEKRNDEQRMELQQQQEQMQQMEQMQEQEEQMEMRVPSQYDRPTRPLDFNRFADQQNQGFFARFGRFYRQEQDERFRKMELHYEGNDRPDFISERAETLFNEMGRQKGFPAVYQLVVKTGPGKFKACFITAAEWEESIRDQMRESRSQASIYQLTSRAFAIDSRRTTAQTLRPLDPEDELHPAFIEQQLRMKFWLNWPEMTPEEWDYLRINFDRLENVLERSSRGTKILHELKERKYDSANLMAIEQRLFRIKAPGPRTHSLEDCVQTFITSYVVNFQKVVDRRDGDEREIFMQGAVERLARILEAQALGLKLKKKPRQPGESWLETSYIERSEERRILIELLDAKRDMVKEEQLELYDRVLRRLVQTEQLLRM